MSDYRQIDEPSPTIVGPRPAGSAGGRLNIPQGMERLLTLAGISAEWRGKVLTDPFGAAGEARIALSATERTILKSIPRKAMESMIGSFAKRNGGTFVSRLAGAAAVAAAALLANTNSYGGDAPVAVDGARADSPPTKGEASEDAPPVLWVRTLDEALAQAKESNRAVMAVFLHPNPSNESMPPMPVAGAMRREPTAEEKSQRICNTNSKDFRAAVKSAQVWAVRVAKPFPPPKPTTPEAEKAFEDSAKAYEALLKKCEIAENLPAVVFLAPDGSLLSKVVKPDEESKLIAGINAVPPLLAKWITDQRVPVPPPVATKGVRPSVGVSRGVRPDVPKGE